MNDEMAQALALKLQQDGKDISAILVENIAAEAERSGRPLDPVNVANAMGPLLSAAWELAKLAHANEAEARVGYSGLLRQVADSIGKLPPPEG
ncbi:hypothetical protein [Altericroceibacterium xinjiangense]|uniref:hypothetical protein n=1 Tax=Altericroceibacterium xinjiangense TaxID=762261 RepID=UPI000F7F6117|nr:hypothetical protein [Altericroceibacterium xinjiangense]